MPDVQAIIKYGNSLKTRKRTGKQFGRCRRDPWHDEVDQFLLNYFITTQKYGVSGGGWNAPRAGVGYTLSPALGPNLDLAQTLLGTVQGLVGGIPATFDPSQITSGLS
ncbi:hypothetical protein Fcan01_27617 [Folsomia candida]|uniref:Uncharacterized protein n=1 Tax=Folsomia candida TaxID=158441 RepID=A0A226CX90_FOLCA|nr:hypothetical protein Fcan01_27617 [Folsomia candida]